MSNNTTKRTNLMESIVFVGFGLAAVYWTLDSLIYVMFFPQAGFYKPMFHPDISILTTRMLVFCFFIIFGSHVQYTLIKRRQIEEALQQSEKKYNIITESIEDGYYEVDVNGNFTFYNKAMRNILGCSDQEMKNISSRNVIGDENAANVYETFKNIDNFTLQTGTASKTISTEIVGKDGRRKFIETSVSIIEDQNGKPTGFRGITRDVTERKKAEEMNQARIAAEAANKAKSEFLANMSHEIRTPLNGIVGMAELAMETDLNDVQRNIIHTINSESNSLLSVINDILDFSKIEAKMLELEKIPFNLENLVEDVVQSFSFRAEQKGLEFLSFISNDVPLNLIGDPGRLRQILVNLAGNALKFTHEGEVFIKVKKEDIQGDTARIRFIVKDTGIGIPKEKQAAIFEVFTQADGSTTRQYGGTGLGTTISKQLAEMMGGEIGVESEVGEGSAFWFTAVFGIQTEKKDSAEEDRIDLRGLRVLVVDDNQTNRLILSEHLRLWGSRPVEVADANSALALLNESVLKGDPFSLILTDMMMPETDGFVLAAKIKQMDSLKHIPVIVLTSSGSLGDGKRCREIGIEGYLPKPIRRDSLYMAIESVMGIARESEEKKRSRLITRHTINEDYGRDISVLLVEDHPTNQKVAMRHLHGAGFQVDLAENGMLAVEVFKKKRYDLILMDIQMPEMDGYEATGNIRKIEEERKNGRRDKISGQPHRVPIIALTAHALSGYREKCIEAGMDDYISKPLRKKDLLDIVEKWIRLAPANDATENKDKIKAKIIEEDAPMNLERALEEFDSDKEFLMGILEEYIRNASSRIESLRKSLSANDCRAVEDLAHFIKGGAATLTANALAKVAYELEEIGKSGDLTGSSEALEKIINELERLKTYYNQIR